MRPTQGRTHESRACVAVRAAAGVSPPAARRTYTIGGASSAADRAPTANGCAPRSGVSTASGRVESEGCGGVLPGNLAAPPRHERAIPHLAPAGLRTGRGLLNRPSEGAAHEAGLMPGVPPRHALRGFMSRGDISPPGFHGRFLPELAPAGVLPCQNVRQPGAFLGVTS